MNTKMKSEMVSENDTELLSGNGNANPASKQELISYEEVDGTSLVIVTELEAGSFVVLGRHRLSQAFETKEEAREDAKRIDLERLMQIMSIMIEISDELKKLGNE